ncbi:pyruvate dehydrogenase complex dihydrolipoamide acetyltransferase [soil metagenome]
MPIAVEMPKMSDTMEEGVLVAWLAEEGDSVSAGDVIAQVETDKATMDLEVYDDGVLLKRVVEEGSAIPIGGLIAVLGQEGEDPSSIISEYGGNGKAAAAKSSETSEKESKSDSEEEKADEKKESKSAAGEAPATDKADGKAVPEGYGHRPDDESVSGVDAADDAQDSSRVKASPLARRMASEAGVDLNALRGTGPEGRIVRKDVEAAMNGDRPAKKQEKPAAKPAPSQAARRPQPSSREATGDDYESLPISQMRKAIARRLAQSKFTSPHFYLTVDVDMARSIDTRTSLNADAEAQGRSKISFNDLITKACAGALRYHSAVNSSYLEGEGEIRQHNRVHVAIAVAIDDGLITPVIRDTDRKGLTQIAEETRDLAGRARDRKLDPSEFEGSTFTTSNLGMFGIEEFTAIINPPNACILAIGAIRDVPVVKDGAVVPGKRMKLTLSCDHRVVDGATGAAFLADVQRFLENPAMMLL